MRVSRVDGGIRSLAAAPDGPETRPLVSASAASIISSSLRGSTFKAGDASTRAACGEVLLESHNSSTEKTSVEVRMMGPFNYVLQLTDIARTIVALQQI